MNCLSLPQINRPLACTCLLIVISANVLGQNANIDPKVRNARELVFPALVNVQPILELFIDGQKVSTGQTIGSGVIFTKDGHVLTNFHVSGHARKVICTLGTKEKLHGTVIGGDPWTDLAVLQLDLKEWASYHPDTPLPFAALGSSASLEVGEPVLAMGSPRGLSRSVTMGIVSNTERYLAAEMSLPTGERTGLFNTWLQTDAAINPGNSGGPLVSLDGLVVGINSRVVGGSNNLGFAVPVDLVRKVVDRILKYGKVTRSTFGFRLQELSELAEFFGVDKRTGALIASVEPGSPGEEAGIRAGDILRSIGEHQISAHFIEDLPGIYNLIAELEVGTTHKLLLQRGEREIVVNLLTEELTQFGGQQAEIAELGLTVRELTASLKRQLDVERGVYVTGIKPGGRAARARLEENDVIQYLDNRMVADVPAFRELLQELLQQRVERKIVGMKIRRGKGLYTLALRLVD